MQGNCYVVSSVGGDAIAVDPGDDFERIAAHIDAEGVRVRAVIATHAHYDHVGAVAALVQRYEAPFCMHPADEALLPRVNFYRYVLHGDGPVRMPEVDRPLVDGDSLSFGALHVVAIHTPGHTRGSVCLDIGGELFTGDTLLEGKVGRTDLPGGDSEVLAASIARLAGRYPADTVLRPGHGERALLGEVLAIAPVARR
jgi:glyoxylase-like metal-dependent hydrolase (beta-lactamase superfamily II)